MATVSKMYIVLLAQTVYSDGLQIVVIKEDKRIQTSILYNVIKYFLDRYSRPRNIIITIICVEPLTICGSDKNMRFKFIFYNYIVHTIICISRLNGLSINFRKVSF